MTAIVTLYPSNIVLGRTPLAIGPAGVTTDLPVTIGGGSVGDDSDSSYLELGAFRSTTDSTDHVETVSCDFALPPGMASISLILDIRARTPAAGMPAPDGVRHIIAEWRNAGTNVRFDTQVYDSSLASEGMGSLVAGTQVSAAWFPAYYSQSDPSNPADGTWANAAPLTAHGTALTGAGLRLVLYPYTTHIGPRVPMVDLFEVRVLVAYTPTRRRLAHQRGMQRGSDGQGVTGGKRGMQKTSRQASLRGGSFL